MTTESPSLAAIRREGAERAGRVYLRALYDQCNGSVSEIARIAGAARHQVRAYLVRYGIGRYAKRAKKGKANV